MMQTQADILATALREMCCPYADTHCAHSAYARAALAAYDLGSYDLTEAELEKAVVDAALALHNAETLSQHRDADARLCKASVDLEDYRAKVRR